MLSLLEVNAGMMLKEVTLYAENWNLYFSESFLAWNTVIHSQDKIFLFVRELQVIFYFPFF